MSKITLVEQASDPATPAAGQVVMYAKTDDLMYWKDDGGVTHAIVGPNGLAAGTQTAMSGTVVMSNSNGLSFGMSGSSRITASMDAIRAISAGTASVGGSQVVFSNSNGISFGLNGSTVTAAMPTVSFFENMEGGPGFANSVATNSAASNVSLQRVVVPFNIIVTRIDLLAHLTVVASTNASTTISYAFYTMSGSTASLLASGNAVVTMTSGTNSTAASVYGGQSGTRWRSIAVGNVNLTPGEYMVGFINSVQGPAGTTGSMTMWGASNIPILNAPGNVVQSAYWENGLYTAASGAFPASIPLSGINQTAPAAYAQPYFRALGSF